MGLGRTCLSAAVASLVICETSLLAAGPTLSNSHDLLTLDPSVFARLLKSARPMPVSAEDKARALSSLPEEGEVTNLNTAARRKLAALGEVLRPNDRDGVYEIKVIAVPQAAVALHARAVILISEAALTLLDADELQALMAHEVGHEYVWAERERAFSLADRNGLKDLELVCDAIAIVTLHGLGMDVSRLMTAVQKISRYNRQRFGTATNEKDYPTVAERRAFARAVGAWLSVRTTGIR
jgi:hypothetical protein